MRNQMHRQHSNCRIFTLCALLCLWLGSALAVTPRVHHGRPAHGSRAAPHANHRFKETAHAAVSLNRMSMPDSFVSMDRNARPAVEINQHTRPDSDDRRGLRLNVHQPAINHILQMLLYMAFEEGHWRRIADALIPDEEADIRIPCGPLELCRLRPVATVGAFKLTHLERPKSVQVKVISKSGLAFVVDGLNFDLSLFAGFRFQEHKKIDKRNEANFNVSVRDAMFTAQFIPMIDPKTGEFRLLCRNTDIQFRGSMELSYFGQNGKGVVAILSRWLESLIRSRLNYALAGLIQSEAEKHAARFLTRLVSLIMMSLDDVLVELYGVDLDLRDNFRFLQPDVYVRSKSISVVSDLQLNVTSHKMTEDEWATWFDYELPRHWSLGGSKRCDKVDLMKDAPTIQQKKSFWQRLKLWRQCVFEWKCQEAENPIPRNHISDLLRSDDKEREAEECSPKEMADMQASPKKSKTMGDRIYQCRDNVCRWSSNAKTSFKSMWQSVMESKAYQGTKKCFKNSCEAVRKGAKQTSDYSKRCYNDVCEWTRKTFRRNKKATDSTDGVESIQVGSSVMQCDEENACHLAPQAAVDDASISEVAEKHCYDNNVCAWEVNRDAQNADDDESKEDVVDGDDAVTVGSPRAEAATGGDPSSVKSFPLSDINEEYDLEDEQDLTGFDTDDKIQRLQRRAVNDDAGSDEKGVKALLKVLATSDSDITVDWNNLIVLK